MSILDEIQPLLDRCTRYETYLVAMCVFHDGYRPNLFCYEDRYNCASCEAWGRTEELLDFLQGAPIGLTRAEYVRNPWTSWLKSKLVNQVLFECHNTMQSNPTLESYLHKRGLKKFDIEYLGIGYKEDWFTFPIFSKRNKILGGIARAGEGITPAYKYFVPKGQDPNLLYIPNWNMLETSKEIYLTFGIFDAISLYMLGLGAMSTLSGQRLDPTVLDQFRKKINIVPDRHEENAAIKLANKLGWRGNVIRIDYPEWAKDPNDLHQRGVLKEYMK